MSFTKFHVAPAHEVKEPQFGSAAEMSGSVVKDETPMASKKPKRRAGGKHQMAACTMCKKKRKKCDGKYPVCSGCLDSNQECTILDITTKRVIPRNYIQSLEETIAQLQNEIAQLSRHETSLTSSERASEGSEDEDYEDDVVSEKKEKLEMEVGYLTLGAGAESRYIGNSSAFSIAKAITKSIAYFKKPQQDSAPMRYYYQSPQDGASAAEAGKHSKPSPELASTFLRLYHNYVQCQYPFLDWPQVIAAFDRVMATDTPQDSDVFFIYMIFAIGSQLLTSNSSSPYTKIYYDRAFAKIEPLVETTTLQTVQAYLMMCVFSQKMPDGTSIWQTTGLAIRAAVALGLHREPFKKASLDPHSYNMRARVFWSAYGMERINGIILGRPFGISDIDIDVQMPIEEEGENGEGSDIAVAVHVFKLRRIQSSICTFVYKPVQIMENEEEADATRVQIVLELNNWMSSFPAKSNPDSTFETQNWCAISYHNSVLLLLRPVVLEVSRCKTQCSERLLDWFRVVTQSTSAICLNYKELHTKGKLAYSWMAMHCVFVSGLTFLYCVWIDKDVGALKWKNKSGYYETYSACLSILYVFAERWDNATMFRDTFEQFANAVFQSLESQTDSDKTRANAQLGAVDLQNIGIDQYLGYDIKLGTGQQLQQSCENRPEGQEGELPELDFSLWEFFDTTGDKFLRDIYHDMEQQFNIV